MGLINARVLIKFDDEHAAERAVFYIGTVASFSKVRQRTALAENDRTPGTEKDILCHPLSSCCLPVVSRGAYFIFEVW